MNKRYLIRAGKYFIRLVVLVTVLFGILIASGYTTWETMKLAMQTDRFYMLLAAFVVFPMMYPFFGFVRREVRGSLRDHRDVVVKLLEVNGYRLTEEEPDGKMVFRAAAAKKIVLFGEDAITVSPEPGFIVVEGPRRDVVRVEFRMNTFL